MTGALLALATIVALLAAALWTPIAAHAFGALMLWARERAGKIPKRHDRKEDAG